MTGPIRTLVVDECADGVEAIERIRTDPPDLVFLDVQMPRGGRLRRGGGPRRRADAGGVFAGAHVEHDRCAFDAFALDYLLKPFDDERFRTVLERARGAALLRRTAPDPRMEPFVESLREPQRPQYPGRSR